MTDSQINWTNGTTVAILNPSTAQSVVTNAIVKYQCRISAIKRFFCVCASMADDTWAFRGIAMILRNDSNHVLVGHQSNIDSGRFNRVESMKYLKSNQDAILLGFGVLCVISSLFIPDASQPLLMACGVSL